MSDIAGMAAKPAAGTGPVLEVRGLSIELPKGSDRKLAVDNASFSVGRGEIVCLVGESGSGKSVIAQSVMGLLPKQLPVAGGSILLEGEDITHAPLSRLRQLRATRMSMVFQEPMTALNPVMSCGEQVDEVLEEHTTLSPAERRAKILETIREVRLPERFAAPDGVSHRAQPGRGDHDPASRHQQRDRTYFSAGAAAETGFVISFAPAKALRLSEDCRHDWRGV